jgi:hypothetical protein
MIIFVWVLIWQKDESLPSTVMVKLHLALRRVASVATYVIVTVPILTFIGCRVAGRVHTVGGWPSLSVNKSHFSTSKEL